MKEIIKNYGPLFEFWWDGANGEGPNGKKQVYDWTKFKQTLREGSPGTVVFSDIGPDIRWVGNENGFAGDPNWNLLDTAGFTPGIGAPSPDTLNHGNVNGNNWMPAECDVSIRPGWFYHQEEDEKVKPPEQLFGLYLRSVGRGASLLLNVPPDRRGLINEHDSAALMGFKRLRDRSFLKPLASKSFPMTSSTEYSVGLGSATTVNCIVIKEPIQLGQRVKKFSIQLEKDPHLPFNGGRRVQDQDRRCENPAIDKRKRGLPDRRRFDRKIKRIRLLHHNRACSISCPIVRHIPFLRDPGGHGYRDGNSYRV